jgi:hypothetical protein
MRAERLQSEDAGPTMDALPCAAWRTAPATRSRGSDVADHRDLGAGASLTSRGDGCNADAARPRRVVNSAVRAFRLGELRAELLASGDEEESGTPGRSRESGNRTFDAWRPLS